jgi:hypothetical protein
MSDQNVIDGEMRDAPQEEPKSQERQPRRPSIGETLETIGAAVGDALQGRANVVMVRVNDDMLRKLDLLVEGEIAKSRSEAAAYMISEGIQAKQELFDKIGALADQISQLRTQLRETIKKSDK